MNDDTPPVDGRFFRGLLIAVPLAALTWIGGFLAVWFSPWWLALPVGVFGVLVLAACQLVRREERDVQLAQIVGLGELPDTDDVDLSHLDVYGRWGGTDWDDPAWRCDLENDTGEKR